MMTANIWFGNPPLGDPFLPLENNTENTPRVFIGIFLPGSISLTCGRLFSQTFLCLSIKHLLEVGIKITPNFHRKWHHRHSLRRLHFTFYFLLFIFYFFWLPVVQHILMIDRSMEWLTGGSQFRIKNLDYFGDWFVLIELHFTPIPEVPMCTKKQCFITWQHEKK